MYQTLFVIDHYFFENHILLIGWLVLGVVYLGFQISRGQKSEAMSFLPVVAVGTALIYFVFPNLETMGVDATNPNGPFVPEGLGIQGYGVCLLLAMLCGFGLVLYRCNQIGLDSEKILSLCFWMVVVGLIGARLFYVIQKFDSFSEVQLSQLVFKMLNMTSGGLVVYGSLIGGILAAVVFLYIHKMPWRTVADVMAPGMIIGLAIGRIGCLMNGCCYGGVCESDLPGIYFPAGSAPYVDQLSTGKLLGAFGPLDEASNLVSVETVVAGSQAEEIGIEPGDQINVFLSSEHEDDPTIRLRAAKSGVAEMQVNAGVYRDPGQVTYLPAKELPDYSLKTHPTQIYSSVNAALLCAFLWFYFPYRRNSGEVFAWLLIIYPIGRFILEIIRQDELGQFGTNFTISQWVSFGVFALGIALMAYVKAVPESADLTGISVASCEN